MQKYLKKRCYKTRALKWVRKLVGINVSIWGPTPRRKAMCPAHYTKGCQSKGKVALGPRRPTRPELIPVSVAWSNWEYCYSPLDGMLVHRRVTPQQYVAGTHLYTWVERDNVGQSVLSKETTQWQGLGIEPPTFRSVQRTNKICPTH